MATTLVSPELHKSVSEFLSKPRKMLIDGKWVDSVSGKTFDTYNPATGEVLAKVAEGDRSDIEQAVKAARRAFESGKWPDMSASKRGRLLWKLAALIEAHLEEFAQLESRDGQRFSIVERFELRKFFEMLFD